jgi:hypothetical protein
MGKLGTGHLMALKFVARRADGDKIWLYAAKTLPRPPTPQHVTMNGAQRLNRVLDIDIRHCTVCVEKYRIIASTKQPHVIAPRSARWSTCQAVSDIRAA